MERTNRISPDVSGPGAIGRIAIADTVRRSARKFGEKTAIVDGDRRVSYAAFDADVDRLANALLARGLHAGDRVATFCSNSYACAVAIYAIQRAGLVWLPVNHNLRPDDVDYILGHAEPRFAIVDDAVLDGPLRATLEKHLPDLAIVRFAGGTTTPYVSFDDLLNQGSPADCGVRIDDRDVCQIMYTSGTTGRPKGVMHTHLSTFVAMLGNVIDFEMRSSDISNAVLPLYHCGMHTFFGAIVVSGAQAVMMRTVDPGALIETIARERVTVALTLPPFYAGMLDHPALAQNDISSLRLCVYGLMQMPEPALRRLIAEICPNFQLATGQTEMYPCTLTFKPEQNRIKFGPYWGDSTVITETAIMDDEGHLLPQGANGEIVHRGPNVMAGYFRDPEATEKSRAFGWHHTGDLGEFDADGQLVFTDRKKDMIKTGGENVASIVVERALLAHPAVASAAAVGLPHPHWFEAVTAIVLLKPDVTASAADIIAHCKSKLSIHEVPKGVCFVDAFPLTSTGKIQKNLLREQFGAHYADLASSAVAR